MKHTTLVRLIFAFATVICLWNWLPYFLHATWEGAWEWNSLTLLNIVELRSLKSPSMGWDGHSFKAIAIAPIVIGCMPLIAGLYGAMRPTAKALLPVTAICSTLVAISIIVIYSGIYAVLSQKHRPILDAGAGTYIAFLTIGLEVLAVIISRRKGAST